MDLRWLFALIGAGLLVVPVLDAPTTVQAQETDQAGSEDTDVVTFYGHVFGHGRWQPMPSNTEAPIGEDNYGLGYIAACEPTGATAGGGLVNGTCEESGNKRLALFSTAGFVDVETPSQWQAGGTYSQLHNERGQTQPIRLDTNQSITADIFLAVDGHGWPASTLNDEPTSCAYPHPEDVACVYPYWGWDPGVQPDSKVTAEFYTATLGERGANASSKPPVSEALTSGDATLVAKGSIGPEMVMNGLPGTAKATQFTIDLGPPEVDTIEPDQGFFMVYRWNQESGGQSYATSTWRVYSGEFFPPSYDLPVKNAFTVERVLPQFAQGKLASLGIMNTPWGSYDVDPASIELDVQGPSGQITPEAIDVFKSFSVAHGGHFQPINATWIWDYQADNLAPGTYEVTVSAQNFQGSASAACTATFTVEEASGGQGPAPGTVEAGLCGEQTITQERLQDLQEGATGDATG